MRKEFVVNRDMTQFIKDVAGDYEEMISGSLTEQEAVDYAEMMLRASKPCEGNADLWFVMFDKPSSMDGDSRVGLVYEPTYYVAAAIMYALVHYESVKDIPNMNNMFCHLLKGCAGRNLLGHGFDSIDGFMKAMDIFAKADVHCFLDRYGEEYIEFKHFFFNREMFLIDSFIRGDVGHPWTGESYSKRAEEIYRDLSRTIDMQEEVIVDWLNENIDIGLHYAIRVLNEKGYRTEWCCEGHYDENRACYSTAYIRFKNKIPHALFPRLQSFPWRDDAIINSKYKTPFMELGGRRKQNSNEEYEDTFYWTGTRYKRMKRDEKDREHQQLLLELNEWVDSLPNMLH